MAVWLVFWGASMLVVLWLIASSTLRGELGATPFLLIWLGFAAFGLHGGVRRLQSLLGLARPPDPRPPSRPHGWSDDMPGPRDG